MLLLAASSSMAAPEDRMAVLQVEADSVVYDSVRGSSVFTGNVIMHKGSMELRADKAEVSQDELGFQIANAFGNTKKLAFFRQMSNTPGEFTEAEGERLLLDSRTGDLQIYNQAQVRRLRGKELLDVAKGPYIKYNNLTEVVSIDGKPGSVAVKGEAQPIAIAPGRVRLVLTPQQAAPQNGLKPNPPSDSNSTLPPLALPPPIAPAPANSAAPKPPKS